MSMIMPDPAECQHAVVRQDRWDKPGGIVCSLSRDWDGCGADDGDCPRFRTSKWFCPDCFAQGRLAPLTLDEDADAYGCDACYRMFWSGQLEDEWIKLVRELRAQIAATHHKAQETA